jgi:hypothetical protein
MLAEARKYAPRATKLCQFGTNAIKHLNFSHKKHLNFWLSIQEHKKVMYSWNVHCNTNKKEQVSNEKQTT